MQALRDKIIDACDMWDWHGKPKMSTEVAKH